MDFAIPEYLKPVLVTIRTFLQHEVYPLEHDAAQSFASVLPALRTLRDRVKALGFWAPHLPRAHGGMGLSLCDFAHVSEELGRSPLGHYLFNCQAPDAGNMEILIEFGTPTQQERWLAPLTRGETRSCFAMTEPDFPGSNPTWMGTTAVNDGGGYVLSGHKWFTSGADGAAFAIVMAVTDPTGPPHRRASLFIVPTDTPGFRLVRNIPCMGHSGEDWASHAEVRFDHCRVQSEHRLGEEGAGFAIAQARLGPGRIHHCMRFIGVCERSFDMLCRRAVTRELTPKEPLGSKQVVQNWIAESRAEINAARLMVLHAAWTIDRQGTRAAREQISLIKFFVAKVMMDVVDRAIQAHGALGISDDTVLSTFYRQGRAARIYDGADEVHKALVARLVLARYGNLSPSSREP
jgi:alkylation response protein AidB-like acyl-CoA dehydrogenase